MSDKLLKLVGHFDVKENKGEESSDTLTIEGFANTTDKDRDGDIILESAWKQGGLANFLKNPIVLAFHNHQMPIGTVKAHSVSEKGLHVTAEISKAAGNVFELVKEGILQAFSVGFRILDADFDSKTDLFLIKDLELLEVSVVAVPANAESVFRVSKSLNGEELKLMKDEFKKTGDNAATETKKEEGASASSSSVDVDGIIKGLTEVIDTKLKDAVSTIKTMGDDKLTEQTTIETGETGAERLNDEIEKRVTEILTKRAEEDAVAKAAATEKSDKEAMIKAVADLKAELEEKATEIAAIKASKMSFSDKGGDVVSKQEKEDAFLLSKIMNVPIAETKFGKAVMEKAGSTGNVHIPTAEWEDTFSTTILDEVRQNLIVAPLFQNLKMTALNHHLPVQADTAGGIGYWVHRSSFGSPSGAGTISAGVEQTSATTEQQLNASKLATHEYLIDEEEEDAILVVMPMIRSNLVRALGRTWDIGLLSGLGAAGTDNTDADPITGLDTKASAYAAGARTVAVAGAGDPLTIAYMQQARATMGKWGINPSELVYVVGNTGYYEILEDPDFRTMDMVGERATILTGQIGAVNGSPVIVSGEMPAKAAGAPACIVVRKQNFVTGELRGLKLDRDRDVLGQRELFVASRRVAFTHLFGDATHVEGVALVDYA